MNKKIVVRIILIVLIISFNIMLFCACENFYDNKPKKVNFSIVGDCEQKQIDSYKNFQIEKIEYKEKKIKAINLHSVIYSASPNNISGDILIVGVDGSATKVRLEDVENCYLSYNKKYDWFIVANGLPPFVGIKNLDKIILLDNFADCECEDKYLLYNNIVEYTEEKCNNTDTKVLSLGDIWKTNFEVIENSGATKNNVYAEKYKSFNNKEIEIKSLINNELATIFLSNGNQINADNKRVVLNKDRITYEGDNIVGLGSKLSSLDFLYEFANEKIVSDNIMIIEIDGLSYSQLKIVENLGFSDIDIKQVYSVYPSISNVALATILTGKLPNITNINERKNRELSQNTLFNMCQKMQKSFIYIEGNSTLLNINTKTNLNSDLDGLYSTDNEVYNSTLNNLQNNFIYTHFHGYDDTYSDYSPLSKPGKDSLVRIAEYIKILSTKFKGQVYVISDHGGHNNYEKDKNGIMQTKGKHGMINFSDMVVPFFQIK